MSLAEAFALFHRLCVNVETMNQGDFSISYFALAKRYHPDRNPHSAVLMAPHQRSEDCDLALLSKFSALTSRTLKQAVDIDWKAEGIRSSVLEFVAYSLNPNYPGRNLGQCVTSHLSERE